ncbi:MAG TPA: flagellar basal-body MS-ring/collar protein FliF [Rectinemataceae bacterium]|nr:flagellar basal-body MS-ring/collar protein FliF [Rectinemataceae bacterium]
MNEFFTRLIGQVRGLWGKWSLTQKLILGGVVLVAIIGVVVLLSVSSAPTMVKLLQTPLATDDELRAITSQLDTEGIAYQVGDNRIILVKDQKTAMRAKAILIRDDLIPKGTDPWSIFDMERWTITDFERNVNLRRAITEQVKRHIEALDDVDKASVTIVMPDKELFQADQKPVTASVILFPKPGSDLTTNRKKIEGIQKILKFAIEGLADDNIVITDQDGIVLNDFSDMANFDRLQQTKQEQKLIQDLEAQYRAKVLKALQQIYTADRVRDLNIKIDMDMSKKTVKTEEYYPVTIKPRTPGSPYDDSEIVPSITVSKSSNTTTWEGTGFNPQGPAGAEGQTAPAYKDLQNSVGKMTQNQTTNNEDVNKRNIDEISSPSIQRVTVSVNIDGQWKWKYDKTGKVQITPNGGIDREYVPIPSDEIKQDVALVQDAIGYDKARGDSVTVQNIQVDRSSQFKTEDGSWRSQQQFNQIILWSLVGLAILMIGFIVFRVISRELERRRRIAEEKRALEQQMLRENAIRQAEEQSIEVSMSVEERKRLELQEHAINMAKEHPEDVAQLIRTWIREE